MPDCRDDQPGHRPADLGPRRVAGGRRLGRDAARSPARVRKFYDQGYIDDFTAGNLAATMAWSGDVLYYKIWEDTPFEFIVPRGGALAVDRQHDDPGELGEPRRARYQLMDYRLPARGRAIDHRVGAYMSPVPAVQDLIAEHAKAEPGDDTRDGSKHMAESPLLWPDDELLSEDPVRPQPDDRRGARGVGRDLPPDLRELSGPADRPRSTALVTAAASRPVRRPAAEATGQFGPSGSAGRRTALLAPGGIYLILGFILPLIIIVYTSLQSGGLLSGGFTFTWEFANYADALLAVRGRSTSERRCTRVSRPSFAILLAYPMAYWIAFYGGRWKSTLFFLILVPFFVSFVIRTVQWKFILADNGLLFGPLKNLGLLPDDFSVLASADRGRRGHHLQLPAVHRAAALRGARSDRQTARRGGEGPVRHAVRRRSARSCCRCRSREYSPPSC